jgi:glutamate--cysteine ligase
MDWNFSQISGLFSNDKSSLLLDGKWGIEKESQRVRASGELALTRHPSAFGDKLENPHVTTDFSESQIELATSPFGSVEEAYEHLIKLQLQVEKELGEELLWPLSMPPRLPAEEDILIARFGDSPEGKEREIYRSGLALRYGKKMQMICGIHYNFSFGTEMLDYLYSLFGNGKEKRTFTDELYFALTRNFLRYRWLLIYLFGASPTIDSTYYSVICRELKLIENCYPEFCIPNFNYEQYATSLRVSRFGYSSSVQGKNGLYFNSLEEYIKEIRKLLSTKSRKFMKLGTYKNGKQIQLNDNMLQKENEFYSSIRLKQNTEIGETQLDALEKRGVQYTEIRILDLNPFEKAAISLNQLYFLQVFMLFCLFEKSEYIRERELREMNRNHHLVSLLGRKQKLVLYKYDKGPEALKDWAEEIFKKLKSIAFIMDMADQDNKYQDCVDQEYKKVLDPSLLPSALIRKEMEERRESYMDFGIRRALT